METLEWIQEWYKQQCDGYWEHSYSIKIETLDNPGWNLTVDLKGTSLEYFEVAYTLIEKSETDWYGYKLKDNIFEASGDPSKLQTILEKFRELILSSGNGKI